MARRPEPPPPPPPEEPEETMEVSRGFIPPDRVTVGFGLKYGLANYGSVEFHVGLETSMKPQDRGSVSAAFKRAASDAADSFNERDAEVRAALGRRIQDPQKTRLPTE